MASPTQDLDVFVREALAQGQARDAIAAALAEAGWPAEQVRNALDAYATVAFPVPVPKPRPTLSAREAFLYLVLFATLYTAAWHLGSLLFDLINRAFPDPSETMAGGLWLGDSVRWSVASMVVAFPVFVFVARHLSRDVARNPVKRLSAVRRWLTYLTLFIAATVLVGDLTTLLYKALGGEFTIRFGLKVLVAGAISGAIFGYYLADLRHEERDVPGAPPVASSWGRWLVIAGAAVILASVVAAIVATGTPSQRRQVSLDERRTDDLRAVSAAVDEAYGKQKVLPSALAPLGAEPGNTLSLRDPDTGAPYVYVPSAGRRYQLCAVFTTDTSRTKAENVPRWQHGIGSHCFELEAPKSE